MDNPPQLTDGKVRFSKNLLSALQPPFDDDDDDDDEFSDSLDALMRRRSDTGRRRSIRRSPKKGSISDSEPRRRSSTMTATSCEDTQISIEEPEMSEEQIFESIRVHKELIEQVKKQPWKMKKRLKVVRRAKAYVTKHEGELEERLAHSKNTKDIMARYTIIFERYWERLKREAVNLAKNLIPWEMRIKRIESHFGSVVSSYFTFLRWILWVNIVMSVFISIFVIVPEYFAADRENPEGRKKLLPHEEDSAYNLREILYFDGFLKYSPLFYGYYNNQEKTKQGYRIPLAYFLTLMGMYGYSFAAILTRMANNARLSKQTDKDDDCTFTWKLYTGWDYMIGNSETADNKVASLIMSFKENVLEERERKKEDRNWKIFGLRLLANVIVLLLLASSTYAVILVVNRSRESDANSSWWRENEVTVVVSLISTIYPNLFDIIGTMEHNHPRIQLRWQLGRIMVLYLLTLYSLIFALFSKVDSFSEQLEELRPNTTVAPPPSSTSTTAAGNGVYDHTDGGGGGGLEAGNFSLLTNISDDAQLPMSRHLFDALVLSLNVTFKLQHIWANSTCIMIKIYCDSKMPVCIDVNDSWSPSRSPPTMYPLLEEDDWPTPFHPYYNESTPNSLRNLSESANFTETMMSTLSAQGITARNSVGRRNENAIRRFLKIPASSATESSDVFPSVLNETTANDTRHWQSLFYTINRFDPSAATNSTAGAVDNYLPTITSHWNATRDEHELLDDWTTNSTPLPIEDTDYVVTTADDDGVCEYIKCIDTQVLSSAPTSHLDDGTLSPPSPSPPPLITVADDNDNNNNNTSGWDVTLDKDGLTPDIRKNLSGLCWETMFGQELVKLTVMDLIMTVGSILLTDFFRALFVRVMNHCWFWDLEKQFPGYGDFKIAENILHLVNNQGMIWMGMFFSPGLPAVNLVKLVIILYVRSWAVLTCNVPHETVFKASRSNNFYYALLLTMLFLCTLPVGYAVVRKTPSWHCGPFSQYAKIYRIFIASLQSVLPDIVMQALDYAASPGIVIPLLVLLILVIYYLSSVANSLREANKDLKIQLRRERTEERRKVFQMADTRHDPPKVASRWAITKKILPVQPSASTNSTQDDSTKPSKSPFNGPSAFANVIGAALKANKL